jgi:hypothetical protein
MSCGTIKINNFQYNWFEFYNLIYIILICDLDLNKINDDDIHSIIKTSNFTEKQKNKFIEIMKNIKNNIITASTFNVFNWELRTSDNDIELCNIIWQLCINKIKDIYNETEKGKQNLNILFKNLTLQALQLYGIDSGCYYFRINMLKEFKKKIENDYLCVVL